jgi:hypothetical protein
MLLRERKLVAKTLFPAATGQLVVDLPAIGSFSYLVFKVWAKNGSGGNFVQKLYEAFPKLEVIGDASIPLYDLSGIVAYKLSQFINGGVDTYQCNESWNAIQFAQFLIPFGRSLGDEQLWLDAGRYSSLQFRATYSFDTSANGFDMTGTYYEVAAYEFVPPPTGRVGLARHVTSLSVTTAASGDFIYRLPQGNVIPAIYVYANKHGTNASFIFDKITLDVNDGAVKIKEMRPIDILYENEVASWVSQRLNWILLRPDNAIVTLPVSDIKNVTLTLQIDIAAGANFPYYTIASIAGNQITTSGILITGGSTWAATTLDTTLRVMHLSVQGIGCSPLFKIVPGASENVEDALNTREYGNVRLIFTQAVADASLQVIPVEILS